VSHKPLEGRVVVLTGAAGFLGRRHARALTEAGARVVLVDVDREGLSQQAADLGREARVALTDVTDKTSVHRMVAETLAAWGRIDVLVNNAAIDPKFDRGTLTDRAVGFEDFPLEGWNQALAVNLTGMFLCAQACAAPMLTQGQGVVVNVSSMYGLVGPDQRLYQETGEPARFKPVTYSVTKSAVNGFTRYLATYWAGRHIRVNTLTLGGVEHEQGAAFLERYAARTPMGRMAQPGEVEAPLVFLASDASSYMTGANLVVDGGWTAW
jgi:NAD(P)-dependent dehydrogenase (short-subunit alcohol dehydrogenase family)